MAVLGAGVEGRAALTAIGQRIGFEHLTLLDEKLLEPTPQVAVRSGPLATLGLADFEVIVRSPGVSVYRPELAAARRSGVEFTSGTSLWLAQGPPSPVIAVTGTKGKSTTTSLLGHLLEFVGQSVQLGGNLGQPVMTFLDQPTPDWYVVELSSYQLADLEGAVDIALVTSVLTDHLDWHGSVGQYHQDKLRLLAMSRGAVLAHVTDQAALHQREDTLWAGDVDSWQVNNSGIYRKSQRIAEFAGWTLAGRHNLNNLELALATLDACGINVAHALPAVATFRALPHRLQPVITGSFTGSITGSMGDSITCINDSIATTPDATVAALRCFADQPVVAIVGGLERQQNWHVLATEVSERQSRGSETHLIVQGQGAQRIVDVLAPVIGPRHLHQCGDLLQAIDRSLRVCPAGGVVLLSPGAPSFDQFQNFAERGDAFSRHCTEHLSGEG